MMSETEEEMIRLITSPKTGKGEARDIKALIECVMRLAEVIDELKQEIQKLKRIRT